MDLAGSEKVSKSESVGETLEEVRHLVGEKSIEGAGQIFPGAQWCPVIFIFIPLFFFSGRVPL